MVLEEIRQLEGSQDFLRPPCLCTLLSAAANRPVGILDASKTGCDALVLTSTGVRRPSNVELHSSAQFVQFIKDATVPGSRDPLHTESPCMPWAAAYTEPT